MSKLRPCVMAVDDDELMLRYMDIALKRAGYAPVLVDRPGGVPTALRDAAPDVVLLDIRMPEASGFEVFRRIRQESDVPVIFMSASPRPTDRRHALDIGGARFVEKPFRPAFLLETIGAVLANGADGQRRSA